MKSHSAFCSLPPFVVFNMPCSSKQEFCRILSFHRKLGEACNLEKEGPVIRPKCGSYPCQRHSAPLS